MGKESFKPVITITTESTSVGDFKDFLRKSYGREKKSNQRFDKRRNPITADDLKEKQDSESLDGLIPYHGREARSGKKAYDIVKTSTIGPYRVFTWGVKAAQEKYGGEKLNPVWNEIEVEDNPMEDFEDILDEPSFDGEKKKVIMVKYGSTSIDVRVIHPLTKDGPLESYREMVFELSEKETLDKNREELNKKFGKGFDHFLEVILEGGGKIPTAGELSRKIAVSFPTAQRMIEDYLKEYERIKRKFKKIRG